MTGLKPTEGGVQGDIEVTESGLNHLIKSYCRESGVRNLRKQIEKIFRKAAFQRVKDNKQGIVIDTDDLHT